MPAALLAPGKPVTASRVRAHKSGCLLSLPPAWGRVHVHAAFFRLHHPPPWSATSTCFHHYYVKGTRAHGAQCSQSQSLAGELGEPASLQALHLSESPFPSVLWGWLEGFQGSGCSWLVLFPCSLAQGAAVSHAFFAVNPGRQILELP